MTSTLDAIVIGAGQAGLAAGYYLRQAGASFTVLEASRVGDSWARRWDSLKLFTPARYNSLPGKPFPGKPYDLPGKDEVAAYLRDYAAHYALPVREHTGVTSVRREQGRFVVALNAGETLTARSVIVATGANQRPYKPGIAADIAPQVVQLHSSEYRNPAQLPAGRVLVVGAGNSGAQIALELAGSGRQVMLAGPAVGALPRRVLGRDIYDWIWHTRLRVSGDTAWGRRMMQSRRYSADPLIGIPPESLEGPNLVRVGRVVGVRDGVPQLNGGAEARGLAAVVWSTGYRPDYSWIELPVFGLDGYPIHHRGVTTGMPGLAFVGMRYQHRTRSALLGGVGEDAEHVVTRLGAHFSSTKEVESWNSSSALSLR